MKRTITQNLIKRLAAQAEEAEFQNLEKLATRLTSIVVKNAEKVREDDDHYTYSKEELEEDLENSIWDAALRVADFYDCSLKSEEIQPIVEQLTNELIEQVKKSSKVKSEVGAHEPPVPGEDAVYLLVEVPEE